MFSSDPNGASVPSQFLTATSLSSVSGANVVIDTRYLKFEVSCFEVNAESMSLFVLLRLGL
jgi:hypothetical protein